MTCDDTNGILSRVNEGLCGEIAEVSEVLGTGVADLSLETLGPG